MTTPDTEGPWIVVYTVRDIAGTRHMYDTGTSCLSAELTDYSPEVSDAKQYTTYEEAAAVAKANDKKYLADLDKDVPPLPPDEVLNYYAHVAELRIKGLLE